MGVYGRMLMKTSPRYRLRVMEAALEAVDEQLDRVQNVQNDDLTDPILTILSVIGCWREGLIYDR